MAVVDTVMAFLRGMFGHSEDSTGVIEEDVRRIFRRTIHLEKVVDANAAAVTASSIFHRCNTASKVVNAYYLPRAAATADNSNFATLILLSGDGSGVPATTVASATTDADGTPVGLSMADGVPFELVTQVAAELPQAAGDVLALQITKTGTGVIVPAGMLVIEMEEL